LFAAAVYMVITRLLLGDTMLNEDCFRCGFITSPMCECGCDGENIEHFLLLCPKYIEHGINRTTTYFMIVIIFIWSIGRFRRSSVRSGLGPQNY